MGIFLGTLPLPEPQFFILLLGIAFLGGFLTSGFGIGGGVMMTTLSILFLPVKLGIPLLAPLSLVMAATALRQYWTQWDWRHILVLMPASLVGVWLGTYLLAVITPQAVSRAVGIVAMLFGGVQLLVANRAEWKERFRPPPWQGLFFGFGAGVTTALAHSGGIIYSFYLLPNSRTKELFVGTAVFLFFTTAVLKMGTYFYYHLLNLPILWASLLLIPALFLGSIAGKKFNARLSNRLFLRIVSLLVVLLGVKLAFW